ncbi:MAG TPA: discoidin domain-containing protein, partial [Pyrinomonadaceae bacterium]|nr:discoidin domain-containing protein [Pyrinomonadaceae bacterium]
MKIPTTHEIAMFRNRRLNMTAAAILLVIGITAAANAQEDGPKRGFNPGNSFALSDIESINMTNGNMMVHFPLGSLPAGRGSLSAAINLIYNNKYYNSRTSWFEDNGRFNCGLQPCYYQKTELGYTTDGGWRYGLGYSWELIDKFSDGSLHPGQQCTIDDAYLDMTYRYKLKLTLPDGSSHEMRPNGFTDNNGNDPAGDYYNVTPDGWISDCLGNGHWNSNPTMFYYSTDGSYLKLEIPRSGGWTLYFPDGMRVVSPLNEPQRIYDRNNNYVELNNVENYQGTGQPATVLTDQLGRTVALTVDWTNGEDAIHVQGFGQELIWRVHWSTISVWKTYWPCAEGALNCQTGDTGTSQYQTPQPFYQTFYVVDRITLPSQAGNLSYVFTYNAPYYTGTWPPPASTGWGELSGTTLPSGAQASYQFQLDGPTDPPITADILRNAPSRKDLTYAQEYDGTSHQVTDTWVYGFGLGGGSVTSPDGGTSAQSSVYSSNCWFWNCGLTYLLVQPDGTKIEKLWAKNNLLDYANTFGRGDNPYVKTEFTSIKNATGTYAKTSIKDYNYDKNGNVTRVAEYDWLDYASVPRDSQGNPTGIPAGATPTRVTTNTYYAPTADASQPVTNGNVYWFQSAPLWKNAVASSEVSNGGGNILSHAELAYDNPLTTGNLTQKTSWDSSKGGYSNPLSTGNSVSVASQYDTWSNGNTGKLIQTTDARGTQTVLTYGSVGGFDIYPTQIVTASGTSIARTEARAYDFSTGLVTSATDADNNVTTSTTYDVFGRPTLVQSAVGKPEETRTATEYSDTARRVIVRSDLNNVGDGMLVTIQHYDQLGRVRLARQLEDATTQSATDETTGIKVQTRYVSCSSTSSPQCPNSNATTAGSYQVASNPYRAATSTAASGENTMGWTRSTQDPSGRMVEVQTFGGASMPWPSGSSSTSTGAVTTAYDANFVTVTDQAGKMRRSMTNGLGQLIRVDEPGDPNVNNSLGTTDNPSQPTNYSYDTLGNLVAVNQGSQNRSFAYSSLSRLTSATNPESGTVSYQYDANGNLTQKTDARSIATTFTYDALNRPLTRSYSDGTPGVSYVYDSTTIANGKGRLGSVSSTVSTSSYSGYDPLGRAVGGSETIGAQTYSMSYTYDLAGHVKTMTYPSGHSVTNTFDGGGRLNSFSGNLGDGTQRTYANNISYSSFGGMTIEQFGTQTPLYHKLQYNVRGQLWDVRVSTAPDVNGSWNRGCLQFFYDNSGGFGTSGPENNGNVLKSWHYIPLDEQTSTWAIQRDSYTYDSLNRITSVSENYISNAEAENQKFAQVYSYDRYGNRTINQANTWGTGVPKPNFGMDANTNRLSAPAGYAMSYDAAGNLTNDTYMGEGTRTYDAENRMKQAWANNQWQSYSYDGDGRRIKRNVNGAETWQVYGLGGELLAEYSANAAATSPQKEYGYRNGELLITADAPTGGARSNFALASNGSTATASSTYPGYGFTPAAAIDGEHKGLNWLSGGGWHGGNNSFPQWLQVDFNGSKTIDEVDVYTLQDDYANP